MTAIVTINNVEFPILNYRDQRVITTEHLAQLYGTETVRIRQNHARNPDRFEPDRHFFKIEGDELSSFKILSSQIDKFAPHLILWTERGAARHAKMLDTDQAWEVFEKLETAYFEGVTPHAQPQSTDIAALAQQLADLLKGKVVVDYDSLCRFARMGRAAVARLVEVEKLLGETERVGLELEKQCGHPLIRLDMPAERLAHHRAAPPRRATAPPDPWEPQVRAYAADRQEVISAEVLRHLGIEDGDQTQTQKNRIANILKNLGFVGYVVHRGGRVHRVWQRHHHG